MKTMRPRDDLLLLRHLKAVPHTPNDQAQARRFAASPGAPCWAALPQCPCQRTIVSRGKNVPGFAVELDSIRMLGV